MFFFVAFIIIFFRNFHENGFVMCCQWSEHSFKRGYFEIHNFDDNDKLTFWNDSIFWWDSHWIYFTKRKHHTQNSTLFEIYALCFISNYQTGFDKQFKNCMMIQGHSRLYQYRKGRLGLPSSAKKFCFIKTLYIVMFWYSESKKLIATHWYCNKVKLLIIHHWNNLYWSLEHNDSGLNVITVNQTVSHIRKQPKYYILNNWH